MFRNILLALIFVLLIAAAALAVVKHQSDKHFYEGYSPDYPLNAKEEPPEPVTDSVEAFGEMLPARYTRQQFVFDSTPGERVPALLTLPLDHKEAAPPLPAIILVHGSHQEKEFLEQISTPFNEAGFAMVCFDQYMRGGRKAEKGVLGAAFAFRDRCRKTVHEIQRMIDYLETRPEIDSSRIYLIGASYGAITGAVAVARDKRIRAAALVVGGGNFSLLAKAPEVREAIPTWLHPLTAPMMKLLAGPADPIHHAAQTAGTPILMLNGSKDGVVSPEAGKALYVVLGEPKEIRWYPVNHPDREENGKEVLRMLSDGLAWMVEQDAAFRGGEQPPS
ncbi:MAG: prolyl oligopeptidase family serine peptidase [Candidatus Hydrogenedentes bacterium]|jgi:dienelactone hydrolase|nr:prolyl oligopeptidase family serine peptidase [Candidatus Hydrogenedentota bacterium]